MAYSSAGPSSRNPVSFPSTQRLSRGLNDTFNVASEPQRPTTTFSYPYGGGGSAAMLSLRPLTNYARPSVSIGDGGGGRRPRIHDLRFSFAVRALETCPEGRDNVGRHMLALSTYMGHTHIRYTYWYLQATPQLMRDIAEACECFLKAGAP